MDTTALQRGAQLHSEGRLDEAEQAYLPLLQGEPQQVATAHYLLALVKSDRGDLAGAIAHYGAAAALGAASPDFLYGYGEQLRKAGRPGDALDRFERALALQADHADARHLQGVTLAALGRLEDALASYDLAAALKPQSRGVWNNRGVALEALGRLDEAVASYERALGIDPYHAGAHHNRGSALLKLGQTEDAIASFDKAIAFDPALAEAWSYRAVALAGLERHGEAIESANRALALRSDYPEALNTRSVAERALKQPEAALASAEQALSIRPDFAEALNSKGSALAKLNRYAAACAAYRRALEVKPDDASILLNLGLALEAIGDLGGAATTLAKAEALAPALPDARFALGLIHIRSGRLEEGFRLYETRWTQKGGPRHGFPDDTLWLGQEPLGDRTLLVHAEQGFGDVIQFSRFAALAAPPSRLRLQVQAPLTRLLSTLDGVEQVYAPDAAPSYDRHIPIMSLPLALGLELKDVAPQIPYLRASDADVERWKGRLPPASGLRIGLAWTGNPGHDNDQNRSIALATLSPLLAANAQFVSLQKAYREEDLARLEQTPQILRVEAELGDFADTAALIACCDLVISVDTSVAHLAGALGKPLWLMLPRFCDWRWMNARTDTPWYPSATLFRQPVFGDWDAVISRMAERLRDI